MNSGVMFLDSNYYTLVNKFNINYFNLLYISLVKNNNIICIINVKLNRFKQIKDI